MTPPAVVRRGFTLIEMIIAFGLGLVLVLTAAAGLRMAAQTTTAATRLSLENALMRSAFLRAHEELDFWRAYDDPEDATNRSYRDVGEPFAPMSAVFPRGTLPGANAIADPREFEVGWDEHYRWPANDKRTWMRANLAEKHITVLAFGRYALFWSTEPQLAVTSGVGAYGTVPVPHTWLAGQYHGMQDRLGYYAFADYMPADALFATSRPFLAAGSDRERTNNGGMTMRLIAPGTQFEPGEGTTEVVKSLWRLTMPAAYAIPKPGAAGHAEYFRVGYQNTTGAEVRRLADRARIDQRLMPLKPSAWPSATYSVMRFIKTRRFVNLSTLGFTSPVTGERLELSFAGYGTTLRGARQQRHPVSGWADYDNASVPAPGRNLDSSP